MIVPRRKFSNNRHSVYPPPSVIPAHTNPIPCHPRPCFRRDKLRWGSRLFFVHAKTLRPARGAKSAKVSVILSRCEGSPFPFIFLTTKHTKDTKNFVIARRLLADAAIYFTSHRARRDLTEVAEKPIPL